MRWIPWRSSSWSDTMPNECIQVSMGVVDAFFNASHGSLGLRQMAAACWGSLPSDGMVILENLIFKCIIVISMRLFRVHSFYHLFIFFQSSVYSHSYSQFMLTSSLVFIKDGKDPVPTPTSSWIFITVEQTRLFNTLRAVHSSYVRHCICMYIQYISLSLSLSIYIYIRICPNDHPPIGCNKH